MTEVDADLGDVVVASEDERSHEIVAAVAAGLEARNLEKSEHSFLTREGVTLFEVVPGCR